MSVLPCAIGGFIIAQLILLGFKVTQPAAFSFGGNGFVVWLPCHLLFQILCYFTFATETRTLHEKRNIVKNKADENQLPLSPAFIETEQNANRIFAMKMAVLYMVIFWESLRESLTKYNISIWITFGIAIGVVALFSFEGLMHGKIFWYDQRKVTMDLIEEMEEDSL
jgi:hypothetical protein